MSLRAAEFPYGLIAGGTSDGYIHAWDPAKIAVGDPSAMVASILQHNGSVNGLQFNPHVESSHLLASGGADGEVFITSLENPGEPNIFVPAPAPSNAKHTAEVTRVAWNTQVAHILASASQNGSTIIWDLRQKRAWYSTIYIDCIRY
jgi:protein transport protein SEC31